MEKSLYDEIISYYPELSEEDFYPISGKILLVDDSDGAGAYIAKWDYKKPIPEGLTIGKPKIE